MSAEKYCLKSIGIGIGNTFCINIGKLPIISQVLLTTLMVNYRTNIALVQLLTAAFSFTS